MTVLQIIVSGALIVLLVACHPLKDRPAYVLRGSWHNVSDSDTLRAVARKYGVSSKILKELNDVSDDPSLRRRAVIFIPQRGGNTPGRGREGEAMVSTTGPSMAGGNVAGGTTANPVSKGCGHDGRRCLLWPVKGETIAYFGQKGGNPHDGIDIKAASGTPIQAADNGVVLYSGSEIKGYGNLVIIRHENGLITVYAHNARNLVKEGQQVTRGETIAEVGQSGISKVPHLHFEVRKSEHPTDPMRYLKPDSE